MQRRWNGTIVMVCGNFIKINCKVKMISFYLCQILPLNLKFLVKPATGIRSIEVYYKNPLLPEDDEKKLTKIRKGNYLFIIIYSR